MITAGATAVNPFSHASPMVNGANTHQDTGTAATVSANDFLALLVTEMKNQDPTAQTDPTQYVNQLVQVNSLEQLIEINENLSSSLGTTAHSVGAKMSGAHPPGTMGSATDPSTAAIRKGPNGGTHPIRVSANPISASAGNLGISKPNPAAQRIAQALNGRR